MKRHLTAIYLLLTAVIIIVGLRIEQVWSGIVTWALASITLFAAAYYTKYIPDKQEQKGKKK